MQVPVDVEQLSSIRNQGKQRVLTERRNRRQKTLHRGKRKHHLQFAGFGGCLYGSFGDRVERGDGTGLKDVEFAANQRPFDVLRTAVMPGNTFANLCQDDGLTIV